MVIFGGLAMNRPKMIVGNWKMYKTIGETVDFVKGLASLAAKSSASVGLAVPFTSLKGASDAAQGTNIKIGAQNMHDAVEGAFTGEVSSRMIRDVGAHFVILGHSERRLLFHESSDWINRKVKRAIQDGLVALVCVGETLQEYQQGNTTTVLRKQLSESLAGLTHEQLKRLVIAYEPVWAIGTDKTATPEIASKMHSFCRDFVAQQWGNERAQDLQILYGGSVKPANSAMLMSQPDIDGVLVGGASLSLDSFSQIVNNGMAND